MAWFVLFLIRLVGPDSALTLHIYIVRTLLKPFHSTWKCSAVDILQDTK